MEKLTVSVSEAAKLLGIGRSAAYEAVYRGDLPSVRLGERRILIPMAGLKAFANQGLNLDEDNQSDLKKSDPSVAFNKARFFVTVERVND
ncbi:MAG: helix-turn-helix domain-containing protein [Thermoleophilia bacterium]|nr:helix-turn-helix domain-containing protein [Thermoleophilia bacterium]